MQRGRTRGLPLPQPHGRHRGRAPRLPLLRWRSRLAWHHRALLDRAVGRARAESPRAAELLSALAGQRLALELIGTPWRFELESNGATAQAARCRAARAAASAASAATRIIGAPLSLLALARRRCCRPRFARGDVRIEGDRAARAAVSRARACCCDRTSEHAARAPVRPQRGARVAMRGLRSARRLDARRCGLDARCRTSPSTSRTRAAIWCRAPKPSSSCAASSSCASSSIASRRACSTSSSGRAGRRQEHLLRLANAPEPRLMRLRVLLRLIEIQRVLVRHRLDDFVRATHLYRPLRFVSVISPWTWFQRRSQLTRGARLRLALEELGPIFVKFGQALSTRRDLLPDDIADELAQAAGQRAAVPGRDRARDHRARLRRAARDATCAHSRRCRSPPPRSRRCTPRSCPTAAKSSSRCCAPACRPGRARSRGALHHRRRWPSAGGPRADASSRSRSCASTRKPSSMSSICCARPPMPRSSSAISPARRCCTCRRSTGTTAATKSW